MPSHELRRFGPEFGLLCAGAIVVAAGAARADIAVGARFETDPRIPGVQAWGDQTAPRIAAAPEGSVVLWKCDFRAQPGLWPSDAIRSISGVLFAPGESTPRPLPPFGDVYGSDNFDVAFAGQGFVVVYEEAAGIVAMRLGLDGLPIDASPRLIMPRDQELDVVDLDCDRAGDCLLVARVSTGAPTPPILNFEVTAFGWDAPASPATVLAYAFSGADAAVAHGTDGFLVAYTTDDAPAQPGVGGWLRAQAFDNLGVPVGAALDIEALTIVTSVLLAATDDGYAVAWSALDGPEVQRAARLDPSGQLGATIQLARTRPSAVTAAGADAILLFSTPDGVEQIRFAPDGTTSDAGMYPGARVESAAFDGTRHLVAWSWWEPYGDGEDIFGASLGASPGAVEALTLSSADNSQWATSAVAGVDETGAYAFVSWFDNRTDPADRVGIPFGRDGYFAQAAATPVDDQLAGTWTAADEGFVVVVPPSPDAPGSVIRVDRDGHPLGGATPLPPVATIRGIWPDPGGGFTLMAYGLWGSDDGVLFVDADAAVRIGPSFTSPVTPFQMGRLAGDELFAASYDYGALQCVDELPTPERFVIDFVSATTGAQTRPRFVPQPSAGTCLYPYQAQLYVEPDGIVFLWKNAGAGLPWLAGRLGLDGAWSGTAELGAAFLSIEGASGELNGPTRVGDVEWWLVPASIDGGGRPTGLAVARTTLGFDTIELQVLPEELDLVAPMLVPAAAAPTLLGIWARPTESNLRVVGYRLDCSTCGPPSDPVPEDPPVGCGCSVRGSSDTREHVMSLLLLAAAIWSIRRRAHGRSPI